MVPKLNQSWVSVPVMWQNISRIKWAVSLSLLLTASIVTAEQKIREVPVPHLRDVAIATFDRYGPVIYYNPTALKKLGPDIAKFVRAHEYAHLAMKHMQREEQSTLEISTTELRRSFELEADCYAAKTVSRESALAAAENFAKVVGLKRADAVHPTGKERAEIIRQCAGITS